MIAAPIQLAITVAWHVADANPTDWAFIRTALQSPVVGVMITWLISVVQPM